VHSSGRKQQLQMQLLQLAVAAAAGQLLPAVARLQGQLQNMQQQQQQVSQ
jgi:hypothetical protein